jgi:hypothetical protein
MRYYKYHPMEESIIPLPVVIIDVLCGCQCTHCIVIDRFDVKAFLLCIMSPTIYES